MKAMPRLLSMAFCFAACAGAAEPPAPLYLDSAFKKAIAQTDPPPPPVVEVREITTKAQFVRKESITYLQLREGIFSLDLPWISHPDESNPQWKLHHCYPVSLEPDNTYTFTFEETLHPFGQGLPVPTTQPFYRPQYYDSALTRITAKGAVLYDRSICEVHHCPMPRLDVPILGGFALPAVKNPLGEVRRKFPHFQDFDFGGCTALIGPGARTTSPRFVCPECRKAYIAWAIEWEAQDAKLR